jgi:hypothetical protein
LFTLSKWQKIFIKVVAIYVILSYLFLGGENLNIEFGTVRLFANPPRRRAEVESKVEYYSNLPLGTVVLADTVAGVQSMLIVGTNTEVGGEIFDYLGISSVGGVYHFNEYGTLMHFNSYDVYELVSIGPEVDSLVELEGYIPNKYLPLGSIVSLSTEALVDMYGQDVDVYNSKFMVISNFVVIYAYVSNVELREYFDYLVIRMYCETIMLVNHDEIESIFYIPEETSNARCFREQVLETKTLYREGYINNEYVDDIFREGFYECLDNS